MVASLGSYGRRFGVRLLWSPPWVPMVAALGSYGRRLGFLWSAAEQLASGFQRGRASEAWKITAEIKGAKV